VHPAGASRHILWLTLKDCSIFSVTRVTTTTTTSTAAVVIVIVMDYQQYQAAYQPMGYNSYHHYQYATPANHLKVRKTD
jgi:hypothetical protein